MTMSLLGALAARPGMGSAIQRYITPARSVGGSNLFTRLFDRKNVVPPMKLPPEFSPRRMLSVASVPGTAWGLPLIFGTTGKSIHQVIEHDLPAAYSKVLEQKGVSMDQYPLSQYLLDSVGAKAGETFAEKLKPVAESLGNKAIAAAEPILRENQTKLLEGAKEVANNAVRDGIAATKDTIKPHMGDFVREMAVPLSASLVGSGLGYGAGSLFYRDDNKLPYEQRVARRDKQQRLKLLLSLLGGAAGVGASHVKDLPKYFRKST